MRYTLQEDQENKDGLAPTSKRYLAFISYSHKDQAWADWLHKKLETYRVPSSLKAEGKPGRLYPIFRDRDELPTAANLSSMIEAALEGSEYLIVICSPNSAASHWVNQEVLGFKAMGREDRILCLIVDGEPNATDQGQPELEAFCPALRYAYDAEAGHLSETRVEPLGADVREHADGKSNALLKIIAGLLAVGFDALKRREEMRQRQRRMVIGVAMLGLLVVLSGLSAWAIVNQQAAIQQRKVAEANEKEALKQQEIAEKNQAKAELAEQRATKQRDIAMNMLESVVMEIDSELSDRGGMSGVRERILEKAVIHLDDLRDSLLESERDADAETRRILLIMVSRIGELALASRDQEASLKHARETLVMAEELYAKDPEDLEYWFILGVAQFKMGEMLLRWEQITEAQSYLNQAESTLTRVINKDPEHWKAITGRLAVMDHQGMTFEKMSKFQEAGKVWQNAFEMSHGLAKEEEDPERLELVRQFSSLIQLKLAEFDRRQKRLDQALDRLVLSILTHEALVSEDESRLSFRRELALARYRHAQLLRQMDRYEESKLSIQKSIELQNALIAENPQNLGFQRELLTSKSSMAWLLEHEGKFNESYELNLELKSQYERLMVSNGDDAELIRDYVLLLQALASTGFRVGELDATTEHLKTAIDHARTLVKQYPDQLMFAEDLAQAVGELGYQLTLRNLLPEGQRYLEEAIRWYEKFEKEEEEKTRYRNTLSVLKIRLGTNYANQNMIPKAEVMFTEAVAHRQALYDLKPEDIQRLGGLAGTKIELARLYWTAKRYDQSMLTMKQAVDLLKQGLESQDDLPDMKVSLGSAYLYLARMNFFLRKNTEAMSYAELSYATRLSLEKQYPDKVEFFTQRIETMELMGELTWILGERQRSEKLAREILHLLNGLMQRYPNNIRYVNGVAGAHMRVADYEWQQRKIPETISRLQSAIRLYLKLQNHRPSVPQLMSLVEAQKRLAVIYRQYGQRDQAIQMFQNMILNLNESLIENPGTVELLTLKMDVLYEQAQVIDVHEAALRKFKECLAIYDQLVKDRKLPPSYGGMRPYIVAKIQEREKQLNTSTQEQ